jgi:PAS domain S-box-containing protein/putative nucleotidyltransferase with HDIG domain
MPLALIVDDKAENLYLLEALLHGYGYGVRTAANGAEALADLAQTLPDVIISDILMPVMDGFTFCIQCKNDSRLKSIPFIFYTATYTDPKDEKFALSLGADLFLLKPIEPTDLIDKINELLATHAVPGLQSTPNQPHFDQTYLKEYNEILIHKLEDKMAELDAANKVLQESESRFRRLAENAPALIYRLSLPEKNLLYINPAATELTGYTPAEFYADPALIAAYLLNPAWKDHFEDLVAQGIKGEALPYSEYPIRHRSGANCWVELRVVVSADEAGQPVAMEGILTDHTENWLAKRVIQESEIRYRNLFERVPVGLYRINRAGQILDINPPLLAMLNYSGQEIFQNFNLFDRHQNPQDREHWKTLMKSDGLISGLETQWRNRKGDLIWVEESARQITDEDGKVLYYEGSVKDITARKKADFELRMAYDTTLEGWTRALDLRDRETEGHSERVAALTVILAEALGMREPDLTHIRRGALLHDIGKIGIPDYVLRKEDALTAEEWEIMHKHPIYAYELLSPISFLSQSIEIPYCHHERWDGSGYPRGLKGEEIPFAARLFSVVDVWDAVTSNRRYQAAWPAEKALEYLNEQSGQLFDPQVVAAFCKLINQK